MKLSTLVMSSALVFASHSAVAGLSDLTKSLENQAKSVAKDVAQPAAQPAMTSGLIDMAASQFGLSPEIAQAGLGSLLKVAQDHVSKENFAMISSALPDTKQYIQSAPSIKMSGLSAMLGKSSDEAQTAASLGYLDKAFKKLGIPKETILPMAEMLTGYLEQSGYGQASSLLKQGLNFL
ncbi:DUF2780 domain-containing protein [Pseudoalteromonas tunicata]|uniref:DUF2780 domain-containing protein n=2 Tax=Pseudoalteromonas tunicata TaxID=314281 RepID=UPI00273F3176|nr:DUF2780 domain-containing protein [Pseudoalteromonas tunicata]MDP5211468.1 DUF2780 domain-containing protein [Pseudoalteromonas tunicata]